jgi:hypothetical protein
MIRYFIYVLLLCFPLVNKAGSERKISVEDKDTSLYAQLRLAEYGLTEQVFQLALKGFDKLESEGELKNSSLITIIDFSQSSTRKRMYVIDMLNKTLLFNTYVAHGRNTGEEYALHFSNRPGSLQSSLGFYVTEQTAMGSKVGFSLIIRGVEKGINDKAQQRAIIMHGADYCTEDFIKRTGRLGRSFGCPSLPPDLIKPVSETIKGGSCLCIYNPDSDYMKSSALLN